MMEEYRSGAASQAGFVANRQAPSLPVEKRVLGANRSEYASGCGFGVASVLTAPVAKTATIEAEPPPASEPWRPAT